MTSELNIADRLRTSAQEVPDQRAVVFPASRAANGTVTWTQLTFAELDREADRIARGLVRFGIGRGDRLALLVPPSLESMALTFGAFRSGAVCVLIDPGMGKSNLLNCLAEADPKGFLAIAKAHLVRRILRRRFRGATVNIGIGAGIGNWWLPNYDDLCKAGDDESVSVPHTRATDPAAIIFTSGSTGPPKGVVYEHGMFDAQVDLLRDRFGIQPGEVDLPGFPLFGLFNVAMQATTIIPDMDPTRPADVDPVRIIDAFRSQKVTQAFGSPAMWNRIGRYCRDNNVKLPGLKRVLSAGAPVPVHVLKNMLEALDDGSDLFTPYGATEALPVAVISGREVLSATAEMTANGEGTCVGHVFNRMTVRIIRMHDGPIPSIGHVRHCQPHEIGEIIVRGPVATREYFRRPEETAAAKIRDGSSFWHRMGDVGYFDDDGRLWFCGRKAHIVHTTGELMYPVRCEAIFNTHPDIYRTALVGVGKKPDQQPVLVVEPEPGKFPRSGVERDRLTRELLEIGVAHELTTSIRRIVFRRELPVDTRHNVKINREALGESLAPE